MKGSGETQPRDLRVRTREFSLRIIRLHAALPKSKVAWTIGDQLLRSATSVGAHYREACRARSDAEFVSKLGGGQQELEETLYWIELLMESGTIAKDRLTDLYDEADQLMAILTTCIKNGRKKRVSK